MQLFPNFFFIYWLYRKNEASATFVPTYHLMFHSITDDIFKNILSADAFYNRIQLYFLIMLWIFFILIISYYFGASVFFLKSKLIW